jgi:galactokinase
VRAELAAEFERRFGTRPTAGARAPGRVNLIGEHTDYNEGLVLPCAIDRDTLALAAPRPGTGVRVFSREMGGEAAFDAARPRRCGSWVDHVQGVVAALAERGVAPRGFDMALASEVPPGAGLASSAALGVAVATALDAAFGLGLQAGDRAALAHRSETAFVGVPCGVMDQLASALGQAGAALRVDCRSGAIEAVPLPPLRLLVADSGVRRELASGGYGDRREECRRALEAAGRAGLLPAGAKALRDLSPGGLPALERAVDPVLFRRARHVISENARVDAMASALRAGDLVAAGACLREGMRSLREDFDVSIPELDALCEIADALAGVYGSRLTGAGFGGCTLHLVDPARVADVAPALADAFARRFGRRPALWTCTPSRGAGALGEAQGTLLKRELV